MDSAEDHDTSQCPKCRAAAIAVGFTLLLDELKRRATERELRKMEDTR